MAKEIGQFMNAIEEIKHGHNKAKSRRFGSVEEEALETYAAKKKAEAMENELRNYLIATYGLNAWQDLLRIQAELRKKRLEEKRQREEQIEEIVQWTVIVCSIALVVGLSFWVYMAING